MGTHFAFVFSISNENHGVQAAHFFSTRLFPSKAVISIGIGIGVGFLVLAISVSLSTDYIVRLDLRKI